MLRAAARAAGLVLALAAAPAAFAQTLYWDLNGSGSGVGGNGMRGDWTTGAVNNWSTSPLGTILPVAWSQGSNAVFEGTTGRVTLSANITAPTSSFNVSGYQLETLSGTTRVLTGSVTLAANVGLTIAPNFGSTTTGGTIEITGSITPAASNNGSSLTLTGSQSATNAARINLLGASSVVSVPSITITGSSTGMGGFNAGNGSTTGVNASVSSNVVNNSTMRFMLGANQNNALTYSGQISGTGGVFFAAGPNGGAGIVTLTSTSSYTGVTTFNHATTGVVRLGTNDALSTASALQFGVAGNATGALDLAGFNQTVASLAVTGTSTVNGIANTGGTQSVLTINNTAGTTTTYSSVIGIPANVTNLTGANNNIALTLASTNTGTQVLIGANTYTGATTINGGTLRLSGGGSIANSATITVASGATFDVSAVTGGFSVAAGQTLRGTGQVTGTATVPSGATIAPGPAGAVGTLSTNAVTVSGGILVSDPGGAFQVKLGGVNPTDSDLLSVAGILNFVTSGFATKPKLAVVSLGNLPTTTTAYTIATVSGGGNDILVDGVAATDSSLNAAIAIDPTGFAAGDVFSLSRSGNSLILTFTPVPEPMVVAVFAAGLAVYIRWRRPFAAPRPGA